MLCNRHGPMATIPSNKEVKNDQDLTAFLSWPRISSVVLAALKSKFVLLNISDPRTH